MNQIQSERLKELDTFAKNNEKPAQYLTCAEHYYYLAVDVIYQGCRRKIYPQHVAEKLKTGVVNNFLSLDFLEKIYLNQIRNIIKIDKLTAENLPKLKKLDCLETKKLLCQVLELINGYDADQLYNQLMNNKKGDK